MGFLSLSLSLSLLIVGNANCSLHLSFETLMVLAISTNMLDNVDAFIQPIVPNIVDAEVCPAGVMGTQFCSEGS